MPRSNAYLAWALAGLSTALLGLAGCQNGFTGKLSLTVSGVKRSDLQNVVVAFHGVTLGGGDSQTRLNFGSEQSVDLEASGRHLLLNGTSVPAGAYQWVRLDVDPENSYVIAVNGGRYPLGVLGDLKTEGDFTVGEGLTSNILININLHRAIVVDTSGAVPSYTLESASRLVDTQTAGSIAGSVPDSFIIGGTSVLDSGCDPQVYVYEGRGIVPEGFNISVQGGTAPFTESNSLKLSESTGLYFFSVGSLPPGTYTLAVTCTAVDVPGSKVIAFSPNLTANVHTGVQTIVKFQ